MRAFFFKTVFLALLLLVAVPIYGQKQEVTTADYAKWSSIQAETISPNGKWISYVLHYDYGVDTLFVQNIKSTRRLVFPKCTDVGFSNDDKWVTFSDPEKGLALYDLNNGNTQYFKDAIRHEFCKEENFLAILNKNAVSDYLTIIGLSTFKKYIFENVREFSINNSGILAISTGYEVRLLKPKVGFVEKTIAQDDDAGFKKLFWSSNGEFLAFLQEIKDQQETTKNYRIFYHDSAIGTNTILDSRQTEILAMENITTYGGSSALRFSDDGKSVFFNYISPELESKSVPYEIWDSATALEYTQNKMFGDASRLPKIAAWKPESGGTLKIGTIENPKAILTANRKYALCYNLLKYEPQYEYYAPADMYLKDTQTGTQQLILEKQSTAVGMMGGSPKGNFIHYFRNGNWWAYDIVKMQHLNLTARLPVSMIDSIQNDAGVPAPYGSPGWSSDEKYFIAYDRYDIYLIDNNAKQTRRITDGRKQKISYRICLDLYPVIKKPSQDEFLIRKFDLSMGLVLQAIGEDGSSGYYKWNSNGTLVKLVFGNSGNSRLIKAKNTGQFIYIQQTASDAPKLIAVSMQKNKMLFKSNSHTRKFNWGTAEMISYKDKNGNNLKGILYKPAGYIEGKKYPMVVYIYEKQSQEINNYRVPTEYGPMGFTLSNYFLDGYLVLLPDIHYKMGEPGKSALDCVLNAVDIVKRMGIVEENHIGIIGHSFGGYETAFIITQTNDFAAAVCGSGLMNTISSYFVHSAGIPRSNAWRFESQQGRMPFSPFDNWKAYEQDAPLPNAVNCTTPLLSWAGKKDPTIFWTQSAEFHMALRRLGKRNVFILYDNEAHTIVTPELQKDLTIKTKNWFDYYLKEQKETLTNGIP
ncbi:prolyl oligopeptidase family protein [Flavobacterium chryseum]|nr:prolyl oligopeptidase family serine peptidase [Flavobacterium cupreum]TCN50551.1 prolyl oligopeptidase family protein [Flavobacterium circumlabens]TDO68873.1 prolyl oligopeptidase family protein [Flavobacterium sp. P3160]